MKIISIILLVFFLTPKLYSQTGERFFPTSFINLVLSDNNFENIIVVEKNTQRAYLYDIDQSNLSFELVLHFRISTGKQLGDKDKQGDLRTPQGFYNITRYIPGHQLDSMYGTGAYPLDFPNELDRRLGKTGGGIWLHGTNKQDLFTYDTEGCVRFENEDLDRLKKHVIVGKTPVLIKDNINWVSYERIHSIISAFQDRVEDWRLAWESNDVRHYLSFYHPDFYTRSQDMNLLRWADYKYRISHGKEIIQVELYNFEYYFFDDYFLITANQRYRSDDYSDYGKKTLLWKFENNNWFILQEDWVRLRRRS